LSVDELRWGWNIRKKDPITDKVKAESISGKEYRLIEICGYWDAGKKVSNC